MIALNCLVSAYMMSALYLQGLKQGDVQMTANGLLSAGLFFFLSQAKPLQRIAPKKPASSVFSFTVLFSIGGQFLVHFLSLTATFTLCKQFATHNERRHVLADGKFQPDLVNSAIYIVCTIMQVGF